MAAKTIMDPNLTALARMVAKALMDPNLTAPEKTVARELMDLNLAAAPLNKNVARAEPNLAAHNKDFLFPTRGIFPALFFEEQKLKKTLEKRSLKTGDRFLDGFVLNIWVDPNQPWTLRRA